MRLPYEALLICLVLFVNNGEGKKMSFTFKKTVGSNTLQIVDFHVMKGKSVKETGEIHVFFYKKLGSAPSTKSFLISHENFAIIVLKVS